jgi:hypothetical protein
VETGGGHKGTGECWWGIASTEHPEPGCRFSADAGGC